MDKRKAEEMSASLIGKAIGGWVVEKYVNHGKSAVVFLARRADRVGALKIFDPEIVERYGRKAQLVRIDRQLSLVGKTHPNLVATYDGGEDSGLVFVAMEYFPGRNIAEALPEIPHSAVRSLVSQVASAAKFLEDSSFAHRDIKPENVGLSPNMRTAKLLDLGVIRPLDLSNITDEGERRFFIGTLQYSPPELLFREEEQSIEGWRAISFYQLGGILHDLLVRKPLFEDFKNPYGRLVQAVEREIPRIHYSDSDADLRLLAQNCLAKAPSQRLDTVKWEDFSKPEPTDPLDTARRRIAQHRVAAAQAPHSQPNEEDLLANHIYVLRTSIQSALVNAIKAETLPRYSIKVVREANPVLIRTLFEPFPKDDLRCVFCLYCQGAAVDATAGLLELRVWGCVCPTREQAPTEPEHEAPHSTVKGTLIAQDIRTHIQRSLLLAYAEALDSESGLKIVSWLRIGGDL